MPQIFSPDFHYLYVAFPEDGLFYIYPGIYIEGSFFAAARAWYRGAVEREGDIYVTEPYRDFITSTWLVTLS